MTTLVLPRGHRLIVDQSDLPLVNQHKWHAIPARSTFYAQAEDPYLMLHRLLLTPPPNTEVDHINRNGLDNRRINLRIATRSQNKANRPKNVNNTSGYKGVAPYRGKWHAYITVDGRRQHLGYFIDPWEAAQAYNSAALEAWGEFAFMNQEITTQGTTS